MTTTTTSPPRRRPAAAPAYYLGHTAAAWQAALRRPARPGRSAIDQGAGR